MGSFHCLHDYKPNLTSTRAAKLYLNLQEQMNCLNCSVALILILTVTTVLGKTYLIETAVGGEEGTDYAEEPTEGVEVEPEKKKVIDGSAPEVEAVPEVNYESMVKGLATMIDSDDKNMNACGKGNLPTKCVCDDGVSFEPQGIFKKYAKNWQPIMEAFALCKTGNAISCECANGGKFIMPPLNENVRKVIEAEKKARGDKGDYQLEELFKG